MAKVIGIDLHPHILRATLVQTSLRQVQILAYAQVELTQVSAEQIIERLHEKFTEFGIAPSIHEWFVSAIDGRLASHVTISLPASARRDLERVLPFELESLLPYEIEDAIIDYQPCPNAAPKEIRTLVAALRKNYLEAHLTQLRSLNINPRYVCVGASALEGLCILQPEMRSPEPQMIINIESDVTELCVIENEQCVWARTLSEGIQAFIHKHSSFEAELKQSFLHYRSNAQAMPTRIWMAGDGALYPQFTSWLESETKIPCAILSLPEAPGANPQQRVSFTKATALALRPALRGKRINLRRGEFELREAVGALREHSRLAIVCACAIFLCFSISTCAQAIVLKNERETLRKQLFQASGLVLGESTDDIERVQILMGGKGSDKDPLPKIDAFDMPNMLSEQISDSINHEAKLVLVDVGQADAPGRLELRGTVSSIGERDQIAQNLEKHQCLTKLEKGGVTPSIGEARLNYELQAVIDCNKVSSRK